MKVGMSSHAIGCSQPRRYTCVTIEAPSEIVLRHATLAFYALTLMLVVANFANTK